MKESKVLEMLECSGTAYEIGLQYGEARKTSLQKTLTLCIDKLVDSAEAAANVELTKEEILSMAGKYLPLVEKFDPEVVEFVHGEAKGAGMSFQEAFYLRCAFEMLCTYGQLSSMCTSFAATGEATGNGKTIVGRNIDFTCEDWPFDLMKIRHADGLEQLALCVGGIEWDVLNSNGYCNSMNATFNDDCRMNLPCGCYLPKTMRQRSLGAALGVLCRNARGLLYHVLASGDGDIIGVESVSDGFTIIHPENDILVHSNHYLTGQYKDLDGISTAVMGFPDTYLRAARMRRLMERHYGNITPQVMMDILSDHNNCPDSICRHPDEDLPPACHAATLASVIIVPEDRKMFVACGNPCKFEYVEYGL